jgi:hypothetical protein
VRFIVTILILVCLTLACLSDSVIVLGYLLNQSFIAQNLCEKRDEPGNTCQGCCLLKKQLEDENKNDPSPPPKNLNESDTLQPLPPNGPMDFQAPRTGMLNLTAQRTAIPLPPGREIDHPPRISFL